MNNTKKGFTLVELLVVIAILAILAAVSVVGYTSFIERAEVSNAETEAHQIESTIESFLMVDDEYVLSSKADKEIAASTTVTTTIIYAVKNTDGKILVKSKTSAITYDAEEVAGTPVVSEGSNYTGAIELTGDLAGLPGKLYANNGELRYVYSNADNTLGNGDDDYVVIK